MSIGIYAIFRKSDDKCLYVGQSKDLESRCKYHEHINENCYWKILETHDVNDNEYRLNREAFWINKLNPTKNVIRNRKNKRSIEAIEKGRQSLINAYKEHPELREKQSQAHVGKTHSDDTKQKISNSLLGHTFSDETKKRMSLTRKGKPSPHKGKTLSNDTKQKISKSLKGKPSPNKGKILSNDTKQKIRQSLIGKPSGTKGKHWRLVDGKRVYY